jgi:outer membrane protein TolC
MFQKKSFILIIVAVLLLMVCSISFSQTVPVIGLKQAVDSVLKNYPGLQAKQMQLQSANAGIRDAIHQGLPSLKVSDQLDMGTANSIGGSYFPMGIIPSTSGGIRADNNTNISSGNIGVGYSEYELCTFGMQHARVEAAKAFGNEADADYKKTEYWLQYQVSQLYFNVLKYNLLSAIQQKNIDRYQTLSKYIKAYTGSGIKAGVDSSVANAEVSKAKIEHLQTLETLDQLKSEFVYYMGIKNTSFDVDTNLYRLPPSVIDQLELVVSGDSVSFNNPFLNYYKSKWNYSLAQEKLIRKSFLPKIYLIGAAWTRGSSLSSKDEYGDLPSGLNYSRYNYMMGLAFTYNIVDVIHQKDKTAIQYYQAEASKDELKEQESLLSNQLRQSDIAIQAALSKIKEIPVQLKASQDAYAQKSAQYNAGLINIVELTNVSYLLYRAETDELDAESELLNTLLQKAITNNTLNSFLSHF